MLEEYSVPYSDVFCVRDPILVAPIVFERHTYVPSRKRAHTKTCPRSWLDVVLYRSAWGGKRVGVEVVRAIMVGVSWDFFNGARLSEEVQLYLHLRD